MACYTGWLSKGPGLFWGKGAVDGVYEFMSFLGDVE